MTINMIPESQLIVNIKVVGIGGAGINVLNHMDPATVKAVQRIAVDTNAEHIADSSADVRIQLGNSITRGLGTGGQADLGSAAAYDQQVHIRKSLEKTDMIFIVSGMGGGTGSGAAPVVAEIAKEMGILTVAIATKPFSFEGRTRMNAAEQGIDQLKYYADAVILVPNDNLKYASDEKLTFRNAFQVADEVLGKTLTGIIDVIQKPAYINSDFADICAILRGSGRMHMGIASASGADRIEDIIREISDSRLLGTSVSGARGVLLCVSASMDVELEAIERISLAIQQAADPDANIIFGMDFREDAASGISAMLLAADIQ